MCDDHVMISHESRELDSAERPAVSVHGLLRGVQRHCVILGEDEGEERGDACDSSYGGSTSTSGTSA